MAFTAPLPPSRAIGDPNPAGDVNMLKDAVTEIRASVTQTAGKFYGSGVPSASLGRDGDTYVDFTAERRYLKTAGAWALAADLLVSKEENLQNAGTWTLTGTGGVLSTDTADSFNRRKVVTALNVVCTLTLALYAPRDMTKKMIRFPFKLDSLSGWANASMDLATDSAFANRVSTTSLASADLCRAGEADFYTAPPNGLYKNGNPNFASIQYLRWTFQDNNTTVRSAWVGDPVLVG